MLSITSSGFIVRCSVAEVKAIWRLVIARQPLKD